MEKKIFLSLLCTYYVYASEKTEASCAITDSPQESPSLVSRYFPCFKSKTPSPACSKPVCLMSSCCGCILCYTYTPCVLAGVSGGCIECTRGVCFLTGALVASLKEKQPVPSPSSN